MMNKKEYAYKILSDLIQCLVIGAVLAGVTGVTGALLGQFLYKPSQVPIPALQGAVSALLIIGSISMLLSAFFLAVRKKDAKKVSERWKNRFDCFGYPAVFLTVSIVILLAGCLLDLANFALL